MAASVEDDFRDFVVARWSDLESVARVVVLDPGLARSTTVDALARLQQRWREVVDDGRPGEAARGAVLVAAVEVAAVEVAPPPTPSADPWTDDVGVSADPVVQGLVEAVRSSPPLQRAVLAADTLWDVGPEEVAVLLGMPAATVHEHAAAVWSRLTAAHDGARALAGLETAPWERDHDVSAAVDVLLQGLTDPPDPTVLVARRRRGLRRRTLVAGGVAVVALGGVGSAVVRRAASPPPVAGPTVPPSMAPDDRRWASSALWQARGPLAGDPALASLLARRAAPGDHVLWAGDIGTRRVVLVWTHPDPDTVGGTAVRVFDGPRGVDATLLRETELSFAVVPDTVDVVALALPQGDQVGTDRSLLVVLARPTVSAASVSYLVRPTRDGRLERSWSDLPLEAGVVALALDRRLSAALRLRVGAWQGAPLMPVSAYDLLGSPAGPSTARQWAESTISALTGIPADRLTTTVSVDEDVPGGLLLFEEAAPAGARPARLVSVRTTTPNGAVLRTTTYRDEGQLVPLEPAVLFPARAREEPFVAQVADLRPNVARFLVVTPGADRVQLISTSPDGYPVSKVYRTAGRAVTVVPVVNGNRGGGYRVIAHDRRGRVLYDGVPGSGRYLFDG